MPPCVKRAGAFIYVKCEHLHALLSGNTGVFRLTDVGDWALLPTHARSKLPHGDRPGLLPDETQSPTLED
ncbi:hypothetical protein HYPGJ_20399 [Hyphomicrobium sp. GJ21]|nr:hypothetical protein HYPGJ_20399 [Hyphomicrobium sp. GJ21]